ncbi:MAG: hypothetical protein CMJ76_09860 [Planctomycetaceae bacterium]|nr:hypothetical protein [Planctomycetaceae bacterium]|tara:strand:+ start:3990 stop:4187 length:198 start_codon:yes stop_codon:yes gene_type:complete
MLLMLLFSVTAGSFGIPVFSSENTLALYWVTTCCEKQIKRVDDLGLVTKLIALQKKRSEYEFEQS